MSGRRPNTNLGCPFDLPMSQPRKYASSRADPRTRLTTAFDLCALAVVPPGNWRAKFLWGPAFRFAVGSIKQSQRQPGTIGHEIPICDTSTRNLLITPLGRTGRHDLARPAAAGCNVTRRGR